MCFRYAADLPGSDFGHRRPVSHLHLRRGAVDPHLHSIDVEAVPAEGDQLAETKLGECREQYEQPVPRLDGLGEREDLVQGRCRRSSDFSWPGPFSRQGLRRISGGSSSAAVAKTA
jgi:hypothetical protein